MHTVPELSERLDGLGVVKPRGLVPLAVMFGSATVVHLAESTGRTPGTENEVS